MVERRKAPNHFTKSSNSNKQMLFYKVCYRFYDNKTFPIANRTSASGYKDL